MPCHGRKRLGFLLPSLRLGQAVEGAVDGGDGVGGNSRVARRGVELAMAEQDRRREACLSFEAGLLEFVKDVGGAVVGDPGRRLYNCLSFYLEEFDSDALMIVLRDFIAISNGSACTSDKIEPSHVLLAMGLPEDVVSAAVRVSWSHETTAPDWDSMASQVRAVV